MSLLSSVFPVRSLLELIGSEIAKQLEKEIDTFNVVYKESDTSIVFRIPKIDAPGQYDYYPFESDALAEGIKAIAAEQIKSDQKLDYVVAHYSRTVQENNYADIFSLNGEGEKSRIKFEY